MAGCASSSGIFAGRSSVDECLEHVESRQVCLIRDSVGSLHWLFAALPILRTFVSNIVASTTPAGLCKGHLIVNVRDFQI